MSDDVTSTITEQQYRDQVKGIMCKIRQEKNELPYPDLDPTIKSIWIVRLSGMNFKKSVSAQYEISLINGDEKFDTLGVLFDWFVERPLSKLHWAKESGGSNEKRQLYNVEWINEKPEEDDPSDKIFEACTGLKFPSLHRIMALNDLDATRPLSEMAPFIEEIF